MRPTRQHKDLCLGDILIAANISYLIIEVKKTWIPSRPEWTGVKGMIIVSSSNVPELSVLATRTMTIAPQDLTFEAKDGMYKIWLLRPNYKQR